MASSSEDVDPGAEPDDIDDHIEDDTESAADGPGGPSERRSGRLKAAQGRGRSGSSRATRSPSSPGSDRATKWAIDRLDGREKRFSFAAAGAAAVFGIVIYFIESSPSFHRVKGQLSPQTVLVVGLVGGALLLGATFLGRRAPVGFVALFLGLLFSNSTLFLALPFLVLAIWILYRSYKIQREATAQARAARAESTSTTRAGGSRAGTTRSGAARTTKGGGRSASSSTQKSGRGGPSRPEANKRYTPKRPPPPAPKPSRRERKAAQAPD